jgi:hypothetical protein
VKARATTTISILRGTTVDSFGDPVDSATVVATGITASIIEQSKMATTADDTTPRQVRSYTGRLPAGTNIQAGDRIKDEKTNVIYVFDAATAVANPVRGADIRLDLRRVT